MIKLKKRKISNFSIFSLYFKNNIIKNSSSFYKLPSFFFLTLSLSRILWSPTYSQNSSSSFSSLRAISRPNERAIAMAKSSSTCCLLLEEDGVEEVLLEEEGGGEVVEEEEDDEDEEELLLFLVGELVLEDCCDN